MIDVRILRGEYAIRRLGPKNDPLYCLRSFCGYIFGWDDSRLAVRIKKGNESIVNMLVEHGGEVVFEDGRCQIVTFLPVAGALKLLRPIRRKKKK